MEIGAFLIENLLIQQQQNSTLKPTLPVKDIKLLQLKLQVLTNLKG